MKLIVVDDHEIFRRALVELFESQPDFEVVGQAETLQDSLALAASQQPDLILMDLGLPDGSGLEALPQFKLRQPEAKVVLLTIHASDDYAFAALRLGARGFLLKNIAPQRLVAALRGVERGELAVSRAVLSRFVGEALKLSAPRGEGVAAVGGLTPRETEVLSELGSGASYRDIAGRLSMSENTVKVHVHNILQKLELSSRRQAADYARRHGLTPAVSNGSQGNGA